MSIRASFDEWALSLCETYATRSKDQSTKLGAVVFTGVKGRLLSAGYNSFPSGIDDHIPERQERPAKYKWFVHAEANAIYGAARIGTPLAGGILYCRWLPCPTCAMAIIQAGLTCVIAASFDIPERWQGDMRVSMQMLHEAGVWVRRPGEGYVMPSAVFKEAWCG